MQCRVEDFMLSASALSSPCLDLTRKAIVELPEDMPGCRRLECLYLEGNQLRTLPEALFSSCCNLRWLDLRNNFLTHLPASIERLKCLKTLLLEGNQLTSLPPQLGRLTQLTGLNLASNPLVSPPPHVVEKGTRAVLKYLQEELAMTGEVDEDVAEKEEIQIQKSMAPLQPSIMGARTIPEAAVEGSFQPDPTVPTIPQPLLKPAMLHQHPMPSPSPSPTLTEVAARRRALAHVREKRRRKKQGEEGEEEQAHVQPPSAEERLQAFAVIEKQKSAEYLEQWRCGARTEHLKAMALGPSYPPTVNTAPFATEQHETPHHPKATHTLEAMEGQHRATHGRLMEEDRPPSQFRTSREQALKERVLQYNKALQEQRKQARLISSPSSDLLQAEKNLAEALAQRELVEGRLVREYRLTAFTADPNLL